LSQNGKMAAVFADARRWRTSRLYQIEPCRHERSR
jgi:hypothetical protein